MSDSTEVYVNPAQQRALKLLDLLAGHEYNGLTLKEVAEQCQEASPTTLRDLRNLELADFVECITETKRWRLSPRLARISLKISISLDRAKRKTEELSQRFTRSE
jgi:DNA-binding IclR family transcriptional regulator